MAKKNKSDWYSTMEGSDTDKFKAKGVYWNNSEYKFSAVVEIRSLSLGESWKFAAFISAFTDSYESDWNSEIVFGRIDPVLTYRSTVRKINIGLTVPSFDVNHAFKNWIKMNELMQALYPGYKEIGGEWVVSTPPLFGIRFHNLAKEVNTGRALQDFAYGAFTGGLVIEPNLQEGFLFSNNVYTDKWNDKDLARKDRKLSENYGGSGDDGAGLLILPKSYNLTLPFTVVHSAFRGNKNGVLNSLGGPAVSAAEDEVKEFLAKDELTRTEQDRRKSAARQESLKQVEEKKRAAYIQNQTRKNKIKRSWD